MSAPHPDDSEGRAAAKATVEFGFATFGYAVALHGDEEGDRDGQEGHQHPALAEHHAADEGPDNTRKRLPEASPGAPRHVACVDCHDPHVPRTPPVRPAARMRDRTPVGDHGGHR